MYFARYFLLFSISLHSLRASPRSSFQKGWDTFSYSAKRRACEGGRKERQKAKRNHHDGTRSPPSSPICNMGFDISLGDLNVSILHLFSF